MSTASVTATDDRRRDSSDAFLLIATCFLLSGFAALLYETVWLRQFAILLGTSEQALAIVLASYMGGLALGSWVASRVVSSIRRPLLVYGVLELAIAISALLVPFGLGLARWLQGQRLGGLPEPPPAGTPSQLIFNFCTAFGWILIPTSLMGATLPLLARHVVRRDEELGARIGLLYGINTFGAVMGTLVAAFILMPSIGMRMTTYVGAGANALVFLFVGLAAKNFATNDIMASSSDVAVEQSGRVSESLSGSFVEQDQGYRRVLWLIAASGAISFCYEILFTRMLSHLVGGSVYAFATMLAGFLLGIALGGSLASRWAKTRRAAAIGFAYAQIATAAFTLIAFHTLTTVTQWSWKSWGGTSALASQVLVSIIILLPAATCIGFSFPMAIRAWARNEREAAVGSAKVYAMSVAGGIVGSLATAAYLMPTLQYHGTALLAVLGNLLIGVTAITLFGLPRIHFIAAVFTLGGLFIGLPRTPEPLLRLSALTSTPTPGEFAFNRVGASATVSVFYQCGRFRF